MKSGEQKIEGIKVVNVIRKGGKVIEATVVYYSNGTPRYEATFTEKPNCNGKRLCASYRLLYDERGLPEEAGVWIPDRIFGKMASRAYAIFFS